MRLDELQLTKDIKAAEFPQPGKITPGARVKDVLAKYGWDVKGYGTEGAVAVHPKTDAILKLFIYDSKYKSFVSLAEHHPNIHFPVFYKGVRDIPGTKFSYVMMEKLEKIYEDDILKRFLPELCTIYLTSVQYKMQYDFPHSMMQRIAKATGFRRKTDIVDRPDLLWNQFGRKPDEEWFTAIDQIYKTAKKIGLQDIDLYHDNNNLMLRSETLVIIDPFI